VGKPRDAELLDFAVACFRDFETTSGVHLVTGQDLGHGTMSDGATGSLSYVNARFHGSVQADTSKPTAEGNYRLLRGMLAAFDVPLAKARVGLVGYGNIGQHVLARIREEGATAVAVESVDAKREALEASGVRALPPSAKGELLAMPLDAIVVNASGASLDPDAVSCIVANDAIKVVCGSENLAMPDPADADRLRAARKAYAPTELGGMMGYLTAVEEYLAARDGQRFDLAALYEAAKRLETAGRDATALVLQRDFTISFEDAVRALSK
jgi:glutamate dehydrogenase/leucine dehydrogenase